MGKEKGDKKDKKGDKKDKKGDKKDKGEKKDKKGDKKDKKKLSKKEKKDKKKATKTKLVKSNYMEPSQELVAKMRSAPAAGSSASASSSSSGPAKVSVRAAPGRAGAWRPGPAHEWTNAGTAAGVQIWRVEQFNIVAWPQPLYGKFYDGDSYIVLNTVITGSVKHWDIHFWLGEKTSQDEAGVAAYKTVELDQKLGGAPIEHREVQGYESPLFLSYFPPAIQILKGGIESGFNHVTPTEYKPRLLHVKGKRNIRVEQVGLHASSLNSGDVFILDGGLHIYVWQGARSNAPERLKADLVSRAIRDEREGHPQIHIITEVGQDSAKAQFWQLLGGEGPIASAEEGGDDAEFEMQGTKRLMKLSDAGGTLQFTEVANGRIARRLLDTNDAFILDSGAEIFAWIGKKASATERSRALAHAQQYLIQNNRPAYLPISRVYEGGENEVFNTSFDS